MGIVNLEIRDHQLAESDWDLRRPLKICHEALRRANDAYFHGSLTMLVLSFYALDRRIRVRYYRGLSGAGISYEAVINTKRLEEALWRLLVSLLHALISQDQEIRGEGGEYEKFEEAKVKAASALEAKLKEIKAGRRRAKEQGLSYEEADNADEVRDGAVVKKVSRNYRNVAFKAKAEECGVPWGLGPNGENKAPTSMFLALMDGMVIDNVPVDLYGPAFVGLPADKPGAKSNLYRYVCSCGFPPTWCAVSDRWHICGECGREIIQTDAPPGEQRRSAQSPGLSARRSSDFALESYHPQLQTGRAELATSNYLGPLEKATQNVVAGTPGDGAYIRLWTIVRDCIVKDCAFRTCGSPVAIATGNATAKALVGRTVQEALLLTADSIERLLEGLPAGKREYAELAATVVADAMRKELRRY